MGSGRSGEPADGPALAGSDGSSMQMFGHEELDMVMRSYLKLPLTSFGRKIRCRLWNSVVSLEWSGWSTGQNPDLNIIVIISGSVQKEGSHKNAMVDP